MSVAAHYQRLANAAMFRVESVPGEAGTSLDFTKPAKPAKERWGIMRVKAGKPAGLLKRTYPSEAKAREVAVVRKQQVPTFDYVPVVHHELAA